MMYFPLVSGGGKIKLVKLILKLCVFAKKAKWVIHSIKIGCAYINKEI